MQALLFGNPRAGTPLLATEARAGLDLPLRALAWESEDGVVRISYNDSEWIAARHGIPGNLSANLAVIHSLVEGTVARESGAEALIH